jgi:hypothetical protein
MSSSRRLDSKGAATAADHTKGPRVSKHRHSTQPSAATILNSSSVNSRMHKNDASSAGDSYAHYIDLPVAAPKCFRIANVPLTWSKKNVYRVLHNADRSLKDHKHQLSLFPACSGATQTALLNFEICTKFFRRILLNRHHYLKVLATSTSAEVRLVIDCHFHDLTPLNTPEGKIVAELVLPSATISQVIDTERLKCNCRNRPCRPCIWVLEKPGDPSDVAERLPA